MQALAGAELAISSLPVRLAEARDAYRRALALVHDDAGRRLLERQLAQLGGEERPPG